jgi:hypothetical protein
VGSQRSASLEQEQLGAGAPNIAEGVEAQVCNSLVFYLAMYILLNCSIGLKLLVVTGYNVKYVCVDVLGALLLLPEGFRCILGKFLLLGTSFHYGRFFLATSKSVWGVFLNFPRERFFLFSIDASIVWLLLLLHYKLAISLLHYKLSSEGHTRLELNFTLT